MRWLATAGRIRTFLSRLGAAAQEPTTAYLTGGSTAVLLGWRESTIDIDLKLVPDSRVGGGQLDVTCNSSHRDGRTAARGWRRTKIKRGHARDLADVRAMLDRELVDSAGLLAYLDAIEDELYRFPAVHPPSLRRAVEAVARDWAPDR